MFSSGSMKKSGKRLQQGLGAKGDDEWTRAEDGSIVPKSFYDKTAYPEYEKNRAEDGSRVRKGFWD